MIIFSEVLIINWSTQCAMMEKNSLVMQHYMLNACEESHQYTCIDTSPMFYSVLLSSWDKLCWNCTTARTSDLVLSWKIVPRRSGCRILYQSVSIHNFTTQKFGFSQVSNSTVFTTSNYNLISLSCPISSNLKDTP